NVTKALPGLMYKPGLRNKRESSGRWKKWRRVGENRMWYRTIKKPANIFSAIVQRKVRKAAAVFVTTRKPLTRGKNTNRRTGAWGWRLRWELNCYPKNNTGSFRSSGTLTVKLPVG